MVTITLEKKVTLTNESFDRVMKEMGLRHTNMKYHMVKDLLEATQDSQWLPWKYFKNKYGDSAGTRLHEIEHEHGIKLNRVVVRINDTEALSSKWTAYQIAA